MSEIKRAIIMAAGEGRRLRPVTLETPKPLIRVNGERILDKGIKALKSNGIRDIYIVVGYKKEMFYETYQNDPDIHFIENPYYLKGNNITSMYVARRYLPEAFVLEADILINNPEIFCRHAARSGYLASWMKPATEWILDVKEGRILGCEIKGERDGYRLWGISMWNREDGENLSEEIRHIVEDDENLGMYWDEVAMNGLRDKYHLEIREIAENDVCEIDTLDELIQMDGYYQKYKKMIISQ